MTSSLPPDVRNAFERFVTCEYTTVAGGQQPITWPVTPYYRQGGPTIDGDITREPVVHDAHLRKLVGGFELPEGWIGRNRSIISRWYRFRRTAKRRLKERESA